MFRIILSLILILCPILSFAEWDVNIPLSADNLTDFPTDNQANLDALELVLRDYPKGLTLSYSSASTIVVSTGGVVCSNSDGSVKRLRGNTSTTNVTFSDIDSGSEASSTTYYVYANCDATATTATFKISTSSSAPTGVTSYKRIGSFYNDSSSDITQDSIINDSNLNVISDIRDFGTSSSSFTAKSMGSFKIAYGYISVGASSTSSITNLPFSSSSSYSVIITQTNQSAGGNVGENPRTLINSGSSFTVYNDYSGRTLNYNWLAIGT